MPEFLRARPRSKSTVPGARRPLPRPAARHWSFPLGAIARVLAAVTLGAFALVGTCVPAEATVHQQTGLLITPGQPYGGKQPASDWLGSYLVNGKQVFCVQYEYKAPDSDEQYKPREELKTKWGDPLPPDIAANISYLLLRYGDTTDPNQAAALAHLLHSWTAPPRDGHDDLNPANDFRAVGYDAPYHFAKLPPAAQQAVRDLTADAEANRGPWTAEVTAPKDQQLIASPADWTITVHSAAGKGVAKVPVRVELTDATLDDGATTGTVTTGEDGTAHVHLTPTGPNPKLVATLSAPADRPYAEVPVDTDTQRVVATGGEQELTAQASASAKNQPGTVRITKVDANSGKGIAGATLRLTGADRTSPAIGQDGGPITGPDGAAAVLTTEGEAGEATVPNLQAPQDICLVEVSPPEGYDQAFDAAHPPSACGTVRPRETLALTISNVPNQVPTAIPAGAPPTITMHAATTTVTSPVGFATLGVLALLGSGLVGFLARRRQEQ